jgi:hypothetical protein
VGHLVGGVAAGTIDFLLSLFLPIKIFFSVVTSIPNGSS